MRSFRCRCDRDSTVSVLRALALLVGALAVLARALR